MKTRNGFVSNSSSSSFVVAFPYEPKNVHEMKNLLFGEKTRFENPYPYGDEPEFWPAEEVASIVLNDMRRSGHLSREKAIELLSHDNDNNINYKDFEYRDENGKIDHNKYNWKAYEEACKNEAGKVYEEFIYKYPDRDLYAFEYSDNDGVLYTAMEHGDLFKKLPHVRISRH